MFSGNTPFLQLARETLSFWVKAFSEDTAKRLENFGFIQFRPGGIIFFYFYFIFVILVVVETFLCNARTGYIIYTIGSFIENFRKLLLLEVNQYVAFNCNPYKLFHF